MRGERSWIWTGLLFLFLTSSAAEAAPVGTFNWGVYTQEDCDLFGTCGPHFSVENFSEVTPYAASFLSVSVTLDTANGPFQIDLYDAVGNNGMGPAFSSKSVPDLSGVTILSASLHLTFVDPVSHLPLSGSVTPLPVLSSPGSVLIDYTPDMTPPLITAVEDPSPNGNGWNNADLTVTFSCSDNESGIATCPVPVVVTTEGAGQEVTGTAVDLAGNSSSVSLAINLDRTAPELMMPILVSQYPYLQNVLLNFGAQDALAGLDSSEATLNGLPVNSNDIISLNHVGPNVFTLSASDRAGNGSTQSLSFDVINTPPAAEAGGPYTMDEGSSGPLDGSGSSDPDGNPVTYAWDLDNNGLYDDSTQVNPSFSRPDNGTFTVGLEVSDGSLTGTDTATVTVLNVAPAVNAGSDQTVNAGTTVGFSGSFTDPGAGDTHTIHWDFGDGTSVDGTLTPTHPYSSAGTYTATLAVTDDDGGIGSDSLLITVNPVQTIFNLAARAKDTKIDLTWTCVSGNVTYNIYRSTTQGGPYQQITSGHVSTYCAYADFGLTNGVTYYYRVTSVGETGLESLYSNEASGTPAAR